MIYQAKSLGASAVLLYLRHPDDGELRAYRQLAKELGLDALVEAHDEYEVDRALNLGAEIVGVNNRDLRTFQVDMNNSIRLRKMAPDNVVLFPRAESAPRRISEFFMRIKWMGY